MNKILILFVFVLINILSYTLIPLKYNYTMLENYDYCNSLEDDLASVQCMELFRLKYSSREKVIEQIKENAMLIKLYYILIINFITFIIFAIATESRPNE